MAKDLRIEFGNDYPHYARTLQASSDDVIDAFNGTDAHQGLQLFYKAFLPKKDESPITFLKRNSTVSYLPDTDEQLRERRADNFMMSLMWHARKVPLVRRIMRLQNCSTDLYIGQPTRTAFQAFEKKAERFGHDQHSTRWTNLDISHPLHIDVGYHATDKWATHINWFYQINIRDEQLQPHANTAYSAINHHKERTK